MRNRKLLQNIDTRTIGKLKINQNNVWANQICATHGVSDATCFSNDLKGIIAINNLSNTASNDLMIVDDHDASSLGILGVFSHGHILEES